MLSVAAGAVLLIAFGLIGMILIGGMIWAQHAEWKRNNHRPHRKDWYCAVNRAAEKNIIEGTWHIRKIEEARLNAYRQDLFNTKTRFAL